MSKIAAAKIGDVVTKMAIRVVFDPYFERLLVPAVFQPLPRPIRQAPPTYKIVQAIPSLEQYSQLKKARYTTTAEDLLSEVSSGIEELGSELRSWHDNLPDGLNASDKAGEIDEAASALENISVPDIPHCLESVPVFFLPGLELDSRPKRATEISNIISAITDAAEQKKEELDPEADAEAIEELESFASEMEEVNSQLGDVNFPSMM
jgi:hypothetical protein